MWVGIPNTDHCTFPVWEKHLPVAGELVGHTHKAVPLIPVSTFLNVWAYDQNTETH